MECGVSRVKLRNLNSPDSLSLKLRSLSNLAN